MEDLLKNTEEVIKNYGETAFIVLFFYKHNKQLSFIGFPGDKKNFPDAKERSELGIYYIPTYAIRMKKYLEIMIEEGITKEDLNESQFKNRRSSL